MKASTLVERARELGREAHRKQRRKAGDVPYVTHLENVVRILKEHGHAQDELMLAAAYLHDLLEDQPGYADRLRAEMPPEVVDTVRVLTEPKKDARGALRPKSERFEDYLAQLRAGTDAAQRAIPISCADKIDNARSLVEAERAGHRLLSRLSTRPDEHAEQLARLRTLYVPRVGESLLAAFDEARAALTATVNAWLRGRAIAIAAEAHLGRYDKAGEPYIEHPLRMMMRAEGEEERLVAVLHDVLEDSEWTSEALRREGFPRRVVRAIEHLTRREGEDYEAYIERVANDALATRVKLLDLEDNTDASRLSTLSEADRKRLVRYRKALELLGPEAEKRSLYIVLDEESAARVGALAVHRMLHADHVTLAHRVDPQTFSPEWIPGGYKIGDRVSMRAVGAALDERVQALVVAIAQSTRRPYDDGILHVTVSVAPDAEPVESNDLLARGSIAPTDLPLSGTVEWVR